MGAVCILQQLYCIDMQHLPWHSMGTNDVLHALGSSPQGISTNEAITRLVRDGRNEIPRPRSYRLGKLIWNQIKSPLAIVLLLAGFATILLGEWVDAGVIAVALTLNALLGIYQEGRASRVFDELTQSLIHDATVIRNGEHTLVSSYDLVVGDVVVLAGGRIVPADMRLIEVYDLQVNESAFTGEWKPVKKHTDMLPVDARDPEKKCMAWGGTIVAQGAGKGVVIATGAQSAFGRLAHATMAVDESETPLLQSVKRLARAMMVLIGVILVVVVAIGLVRGETLGTMLLIAIAVAVAAMPEGLPAAVTVVLAVAMEAVLRKGGLVKSLLAAETLGSTTVILTDKTGTLTEGNMSAVGFYSARGISQHDATAQYADNTLLIRGAVLASDAFIETIDGVATVRGRPVEKALVEAGRRIGCTQDAMQGISYNRVDFMQFESARRYAGSLNREADGTHRVYLSGAPEKLLEVATHVAVAQGERVMDAAQRTQFLNVTTQGAQEGRKFIGVAYAHVDHPNIPEDIRAGTPKKLVFLGVIALADAVRADVPQEIERAHRAGARVIMVTGDYPETARAVAQEAGVVAPGARILTGSEIEHLDDDTLHAALMQVHVVARVLPEQKLRIVSVLRKHGEVVAMTGDGVNDAPALMAADIGVAVGSGTDVAKAASDVVLLNNTFSTITAAIHEGRRAVDNLRKAVLYLLSTSVSEIVIIAGSVAAGLPLPLLPTQLLWTNIIHEGFMSAPYAFEPAAPDAMTRRPHGIHEAILTGHLRTFIIIISAIGGSLLFAFYILMYSMHIPIETVRTLVFAALSITALSYALSLKDIHRPLWRIPLFNNTALIFGLCASFGVLILSLTVPPLRAFLSLTPLNSAHVVILILFAIASLAAIEISKVIARAITDGQRPHHS